jgi:protein involved in polysaccharide export with SLBB domain
MKLNLPLLPALFAVAAMTLSSCSSLSKISVPKVKIPFVGEEEGAPPPDDPVVPFDPRKPLTYGHTLRLVVYRGARDPSKLFSGSVMVDKQGMVAFKNAGGVKIGGLTVPKAAAAIQSAFARKSGESIVQVEIQRVEDMPIITVAGAVRSPGAMQWFEGMTVNRALATAGGHDASSGQAVYVTHEGVRHFHAVVDETPVQAGDTLTFSSDL